MIEYYSKPKKVRAFQFLTEPGQQQQALLDALSQSRRVLSWVFERGLDGISFTFVGDRGLSRDTNTITLEPGMWVVFEGESIHVATNDDFVENYFWVQTITEVKAPTLEELL